MFETSPARRSRLGEGKGEIQAHFKKQCLGVATQQQPKLAMLTVGALHSASRCYV